MPPLNGEMYFCEPKTKYGIDHSCFFDCNQDFLRNGASIITCYEVGSGVADWDDKVPTCER